MLKIKDKKAPSTKNGAKGISLFIEYFFERNIRKIPMIAPDQKERTATPNILPIPTSQPIPKASFASPRPIHLPPDTSQIKARGKAINMPDKNCQMEGICG